AAGARAAAVRSSVRLTSVTSPRPPTGPVMATEPLCTRVAAAVYEPATEAPPRNCTAPAVARPDPAASAAGPWKTRGGPAAPVRVLRGWGVRGSCPAPSSGLLWWGWTAP